MSIINKINLYRNNSPLVPSILPYSAGNAIAGSQYSDTAGQAWRAFDGKFTYSTDGKYSAWTPFNYRTLHEGTWVGLKFDRKCIVTHAICFPWDFSTAYMLSQIQIDGCDSASFDTTMYSSDSINYAYHNDEWGLTEKNVDGRTNGWLQFAILQSNIATKGYKNWRIKPTIGMPGGMQIYEIRFIGYFTE